MASSFSNPNGDTEAERFFLRGREAHSIAVRQATEREIQALALTESGQAQLERIERDPAEGERYAARFAFKQLSGAFASMFSVDFDESDLLAAGARRVHVIETRMSPEARQREYEIMFGSLARSFLTPEVRAEIQQSVGTATIYAFEDGSLLSLTKSDLAAHELTESLVKSARSYHELVGDSRSRISELGDSFASIGLKTSASLRQQLTEISTQDLNAIMEDFSFQTIRSIASLASAVLPSKDATMLAQMSMQKHAEDDAWKPGVSIFVDGKPMPTPIELSQALGAEEPLDIGAMLKRLRDSGVKQAQAQAGKAAKPPKKPSA